MIRKVFALFLVLAGTTCMAQDFLEHWKFRQKLVIDHTKGQENLEDFQVRFVLNTLQLVQRGEMHFLGHDIRVTDADGTTPLCFWFENFGTEQTIIWVKLPEAKMGAQQPIFLYYGNPLATSMKDGSCTFLAFDDFLGSEVDKDRWQMLGNNIPIVSGSVVTFQASESDSYLRSKQTFPRPVIAEMSVVKVEGKYASMALIQESEVFWQGYILAHDQETQTMQLTLVNPEASPCQGADFYPQIFPEEALESNGEWWISWITRNNLSAGWPGGEQWQSNTLIYEKELQVALGISACPWTRSSGGTLSVDWLRIRKFVQTLPEIQFGEVSINPAAPAHLPTLPDPVTMTQGILMPLKL